VGEHQPTTETLTASEVRQRWSDVVNKVARRQARVLVEKSGVPVAAVVSADDLARLQALDAERERAFAALDRIGAAFKDMPADELERAVAEALVEARAERRAGAQPA
jgi:prevent-host-death family protein